MASYLLSEASAEGLHRLLAASKAVQNAPVRATRTNGGEPLETPGAVPVWTVEYYASQEAFCIFLGAHPLNLSGTETMPTGVTACTGKLGQIGWYKLNGFTGGNVWLVITGSAAALSANSGTSGTTSVHIAAASRDESTGAVTVAQSLIGALVFGSTATVESEEVDVVENVWLDNTTTNPTLKQTKRKVKILTGSTTTKTIWEIFETTPHVSHD